MSALLSLFLASLKDLKAVFGSNDQKLAEEIEAKFGDEFDDDTTPLLSERAAIEQILKSPIWHNVTVSRSS